MRRSILIASTTFIFGMIILAFGPRPDTKIETNFDPASMGQDLDVWLESKESKIPNLVPQSAKQIIWNNDKAGSKTALSIVYLHGFSATKAEIAPVPQLVAKSLGANLYFTRLKGHGRDSLAMADATVSDWANDVLEAIAIGRRIGNKVIIVSTSTGSTLATWAASNPEIVKDIHGMISLSPNYALKGVSISLLNMPWSETILPLIFGKTRSFETRSEAHAKGWTSTYPSSAIFQMGALLKLTSEIDYSKILVPHFVLYSPKDKVIDANQVEYVIERWGGKTQKLDINDSDDPNDHVIAGDILSPSTTLKVSTAITQWINGL